jgi:AraC-like DNA-binding protein
MPESSQLSGEVRRVLIAQLANGTILMNAVARELAISGRSLQRRLAADGLSFQQLLDSTRRDAAVEYLSNPRLSLGEIAYLLGYSEPAAFHRAFKRWHRITPQAFRRNYSRNSTTVAPAPPSDGVAG